MRSPRFRDSKLPKVTQLVSSAAKTRPRSTASAQRPGVLPPRRISLESCSAFPRRGVFTTISFPP